jgi:SAM-dependent methyltransferase
VEPFAPHVIGDAYDAVASDYEGAFADDLDRLPVDRAALDAVVDRLSGRGPVLDVGCGPGQVGAYLAARGLQVVGVDLAPAMLGVASRRAPERGFVAADMQSLPIGTGSCAGVVAFYCVQHVRRDAIGALFGEFRRALAPGGIVVLATHLGEGEVYSGSLLGHEFEPVGGTLYADGELQQELTAQSFVVERAAYRDPLPHEHQTNRIYLVACKTG